MPTTRSTPSAETHPFRVGSVVYKTRGDASDAMLRASESNPEQVFQLRTFDGAIVHGDRALSALGGWLTDGAEAADDPETLTLVPCGHTLI